MNPDLEKRVPREILEELIKEGTEAFRGILEKLFNVAMQVERSEFLGAEAYERTASRRGYRNGFKGKRIQTRVGELRLEIPQVRGLSFYPKSLERGCRSEKALKLAIAEMYVMGVSTRKVTEVTEQLCGLEISATQVSRVAGMLDEELEAVSKPGAGRVSDRVPGCPLREGSKGRQSTGRGHPESPWSQSFRNARGVGSERQAKRSRSTLARVYGGAAKARFERSRAVCQR